MPQVFEKQGPHTRAELERLRALLATARNDLDKMAMVAEAFVLAWGHDADDDTMVEDEEKALLAIEHARHTLEQIDAALKETTS